MKTTRDALIETVAAELARHALTTDENGRSVCTCGWFTQPLLTSVHRFHQADQALAAVLMATAQINGEHIAESREQAMDEWQKRTTAMGMLLIDSGDITPMGARMLRKIWEPAELGPPRVSG